MRRTEQDTAYKNATPSRSIARAEDFGELVEKKTSEENFLPQRGADEGKGQELQR